MIFLKALSVFLSMVIGVGIFSLPYMASKTGFFVVLPYLFFTSFIVICVHFFYAEVALQTEEKYRLPGYVKKYLGKGFKEISFAIILLGFLGATLAYLVVGGSFLANLLIPYFGGNLAIYTFIFFVLGSFFVFLDIKSISRLSLCLVFALFVILAVLLAESFKLINFGSFLYFDSKTLFLPYGPILFSLWGSAIIPEIEEIFISGNYSKEEIRKKVKAVVFWGIIISAIVYLIFIFSVLGVSGSNTSKEAISGLQGRISPFIINLLFIFGVISCFNGFVAISLTLKKTLWFDFRISKNISWALACFVPAVIFILGAREFIKIISFTGSFILGFEGIVMFFLYRACLKKNLLKKVNPLSYILAGVFLIGVLFQIYYLL